MMKMLPILALACCTTAVSTQEPTSAPRPDPATDLGRSVRAMTQDLWQKLARQEGNLAFSPGSIAAAIAMTAAGARGETRKQMLAFLHVEAPELLPGFGELCRRWEHGGDAKGAAKITVANRLFGADHFPFEAPYLALVARSFGAPLERLDYRDHPEQARTRINQWVLDKTAQRIADLLPPGSITSDSRLTLVNAVHFLGDWKQLFAQEQTSDQEFSGADGSKRKVPTMVASGSYQHTRIDGHAVVQLEYVGGEYAMLFVLAPEGTAATAWLPDKVLALAATLPAERITLHLPRFRVEMRQSLGLSATLQELGVIDAFAAAKADFTGIANPAHPADRLCIDEAYHKAFVRVDEKGTEAAAATAVVMRSTGVEAPPQKVIRFDRPFAFVLRHLPSGVPLFVGKLVDPGPGS